MTPYDAVLPEMGPGRLLVATPALRDPNFRRTVVYLVAHNAEGTVGVVLNRPSETAVDTVLPRWSEYATAPAVVGIGGPVQRNAAMAVGVLRGDAGRGELDDGTWHDVAGDVALVNLDADPVVTAASLRGLRLFAGHAGWAPDQILAEISEGAWKVVPGYPDDVLAAPLGDLYFRVMRRQGWPAAMIAYHPGDLDRN